MKSWPNITPEQRWSEFLESEEAIREDLARRTAPVVEVVNLQLRAAAKHRGHPHGKTIFWLHKAADTFGAAIAPMAACSSGLNTRTFSWPEARSELHLFIETNFMP